MTDEVQSTLMIDLVLVENFQHSRAILRLIQKKYNIPFQISNLKCKIKKNYSLYTDLKCIEIAKKQKRSFYSLPESRK